MKYILFNICFNYKLGIEYGAMGWPGYDIV